MTYASMTFTQTGPDPLLSGLWKDLDANGNRVTDLGDPVVDTDAISRGYMYSYLVTQIATLLNAALAAANYLDKSGGTMTGPLLLAGDPSSLLQAATKQYVDNVAAGLDVKASCRLATTANDTLSGLAARDGVTPIAGDRVLVKNQTTTSQNGIYVAAAGAWARATDMDTWSEVPGANVWIEEGSTNADNAYVCTANAGGTIGTTAITWVLFGGSGVYQPSSANLTTLAGVTPTATGTALLSAASAIAALATLSGVSLTATGQTISGGARITPYSIGTISTGNVTLDPGNGPMQYLTNNGAFQLSPGSNKGQYTLEITNGVSAGLINTSSFTTVKGDAFTTTSGAKFTCSIIIGQNSSTLIVVAN